MPEIAHIEQAAYNAAQVTETELNGTDDTITLSNGSNLLIARNGSGSSQTISILGADSAGMADCPGAGQISLTTPLEITIPDGESYQVGLSSVKDRLRGQINVTGAPANGLFAFIVD